MVTLSHAYNVVRMCTGTGVGTDQAGHACMCASGAPIVALAFAVPCALALGARTSHGSVTRVMPAALEVVDVPASALAFTAAMPAVEFRVPEGNDAATIARLGE